MATVRIEKESSKDTIHREELENETRYMREFRYMSTNRSRAGKRILEWRTGKIWRMIAESWEWISLLKWWAPENQIEKNLEFLRICEKNAHNQKQLWEDGNKIESRILKRMEQDLGETLLLSSKFKNDDEKHHHESLRYSGMKIRKVEPTMKEFERSWWTTYDWW